MTVSSAITAFDQRVDERFEALRGRPRVDRLMYAMSELGDFSLIWHTVSVAQGLVGGPAGAPRMIRASGALVVESALVNVVIKSVFRRGRPDNVGERPHHLRTPRTSSFPSGHASAATCAVILLGDRAPIPVRVVLGVLGVLVATSRVHVRIHHASDVVGGVAIGAVLGMSARRLLPLR